MVSLPQMSVADIFSDKGLAHSGAATFVASRLPLRQPSQIYHLSTHPLIYIDKIKDKAKYKYNAFFSCDAFKKVVCNTGCTYMSDQN